MRKIINIMLAILVCVLCTPTVLANNSSESDANEEIHTNRGSYIANDESGIPDAALYEYIKIQTGKSDVYSDDLRNVTSLKLSDRIYAIKNLSGLSQMNLSNLKTLELDISSLTSLDEVMKLTSINELIIDSSSIETLPDSISNLKNLHVFEIHVSPLTGLNDAFFDLHALDTIVLDNLPNLSEIDERIAKMPMLESVTLSNLTVSIPRSIYSIPHLRTLKLTNMGISEIDEDASKLSRIEYLYLGSNELTEIPEFLYRLTTLKTLSLRNNKISEISEDIQYLVNLQTLDVSFNQLETLPIQIVNLGSLKTLTISDNPIACLDSDFGLLKLENVYDFFAYNDLTVCGVATVTDVVEDETPAVEAFDLTVLDDVVSDNGYTNKDVTVKSSKAVYFVVDDVMSDSLAEEITVTDEGKHTIKAIADGGGELDSITFTIDRSAPVINVQGGNETIQEYNRDIAVESDKTVTFYVNDQKSETGSMLLLSEDGDYTVYAYDSASNKSNTLSFTIYREEEEIEDKEDDKVVIPPLYYVGYVCLIMVGGYLAHLFLKRGAELDDE